MTRRAKLRLLWDLYRTNRERYGRRESYRLASKVFISIMNALDAGERLHDIIRDLDIK